MYKRQRPGNTAVVDLAKRQVGNVGGRPFWSWYGFNSRVEWCACFVSWCYNQAGKSEPRFAGCQSQGVPWFQSRGQWGARGYENIAPGDAIFFDWDGDGSADHVGLVIGTDGELSLIHISQKMTREGAVEVNAATGKKKRISKRIRDADFAKTEAPPVSYTHLLSGLFG